MFTTSKLVKSFEVEVDIYPIYFDLLFFELNKKNRRVQSIFDWNWNDPANWIMTSKMRKECAISAGKLLVSFVLFSKWVNKNYSSCNKTVIYLLAGKYAVDIDHKNRYWPRLSPRSITIFFGQYHSIFPS